VLPLIEAATVAVILLVVAIYFRSLGAPLVTILTAAAAYVVAVRVVAGAGDAVGISVPQEVEPLLVVLPARARHGLHDLLPVRGPPATPARRGAARGGPPGHRADDPHRLHRRASSCPAAPCPAGGELEFFNAFGPGLAVSALIVTIVCITLVPAILAIAGPWLFGRKVRNAEVPDVVEPALPPAPAGGHVRLDAPRRERWRGRMAGPLGAVRVSRRLAEKEGRHPVVYLGQRMLAWRPIAFLMVLVCVGVMGIAASAVTRADLSVGFVSSLPRESEPRRAGDDAARGFVPGIVAPVDVVFERGGIGRDLGALNRLQERVSAQEGIAAVLGPRETAGTAWRASPSRRRAAPRGCSSSCATTRRGATASAPTATCATAMPGILDAAGVEARACPTAARRRSRGDDRCGPRRPGAHRDRDPRIGFVLLAIFMRSLVAPIILLFASVLAFARRSGSPRCCCRTSWAATR
jgi:RND superfamily putative drug exporter